MPRRILVLTLAVAVCTTGVLLAQGRTKTYGRATVQYQDNRVLAVANYDYSQDNHDGPWLLIDFAIQTTDRFVINRDQLSLLTPDERRLPLASHEQFLAHQATLTRMLQNAATKRRPLGGYFTSPLVDTIKFFSEQPGTIIQNTVATHRDEIPTGPLLFYAPDGKWLPGTYRLALNSDRARVELPLELK